MIDKSRAGIPKGDGDPKEAAYDKELTERNAALFDDVRSQLAQIPEVRALFAEVMASATDKLRAEESEDAGDGPPGSES